MVKVKPNQGTNPTQPLHPPIFTFYFLFFPINTGTCISSYLFFSISTLLALRKRSFLCRGVRFVSFRSVPFGFGSHFLTSGASLSPAHQIFRRFRDISFRFSQYLAFFGSCKLDLPFCFFANFGPDFDRIWWILGFLLILIL